MPDDLHRAIRVKAAQAGMSMTKYILSLLKDDVAIKGAADDK